LRVPIGQILSSRWCRCRETAELIDMGTVTHLPALDSFFEDRSRRGRQRAEILAFIHAWRGPGNALLVTHQVNITAVTQVFPRSGEIVVLTPDAEVLGRFSPPQPGQIADG
jgi:phosphohistidine phosphatase SixA